MLYAKIQYLGQINLSLIFIPTSVVLVWILNEITSPHILYEYLFFLYEHNVKISRGKDYRNYLLIVAEARSLSLLNKTMFIKMFLPTKPDLTLVLYYVTYLAKRKMDLKNPGHVVENN